jgi:hypothetical protein
LDQAIAQFTCENFGLKTPRALISLQKLEIWGASNGEQVRRVAHLAMVAKRSVDFTGYWQRHMPPKQVGLS